MKLLAFILVCYGVTNILTTARIFEGIRGWLSKKFSSMTHFIRCPMCVGFWIGGGLSFFGICAITPTNPWDNAMCSAFLSSGACWMIRVVLHRLGEDGL